MSKHFLVVGAGFAGAVYGRVLASAGHRVHVIDKRPHIGGNAYDEVDANGLRVHRYGPHLFHTRNARVADWVKQFVQWMPYEHRVRARLQNGDHVPLPINLNTLRVVFGATLSGPEEAEALLARLAVTPAHEPRNAAEYLYSRIGQELTDLFFRPYTKKMWAFDLEDMDASVVKRIPLRFDEESRYFPNDEFQGLPEGGYTRFFERLFDHPGIRVETSLSFDPAMLSEYEHCFNSMPIDEFFAYELGELPYRSIRFENVTIPIRPADAWATTNYTDDRPQTRETRWDLLPGHVVRATEHLTLTVEEPCDYKDNGLERYYPVKTADGRYQERYEAYRKLAAERLDRMTFIGRCGTYQYLDMDQVINQSLQGAMRFCENLR